MTCRINQDSYASSGQFALSSFRPLVTNGTFRGRSLSTSNSTTLAETTKKTVTIYSA